MGYGAQKLLNVKFFVDAVLSMPETPASFGDISAPADNLKPGKRHTTSTSTQASQS